jgi:pyruvate-formate lyase-activating enzyme
LGKYIAFVGTGDTTKENAVGLLNAWLPESDVYIYVPAVISTRGMETVSTWLHSEFTDVLPTEAPVALLTEYKRLGNDVTLIFLWDEENPESDELLEAATREGIECRDLTQALHVINWAPAPEEPEKPVAGRRRSALEAYQETSNDIRDEIIASGGDPEPPPEVVKEAIQAVRERTAATMQGASSEITEEEELGLLENDGTISPLPASVIDDDGKALPKLQALMAEPSLFEGMNDTSAVLLHERTADDVQRVDRLAQDLLDTLMVLIREVVRQEIDSRMPFQVHPGVHTQENMHPRELTEEEEAEAHKRLAEIRASRDALHERQTVLVEPTEIEDPAQEKIPYVYNTETKRYSPRAGQKGRLRKGSELMYLTQQMIDDARAKGLIDE